MNDIVFDRHPQGLKISLSLSGVNKETTVSAVVSLWKGLMVATRPRIIWNRNDTIEVKLLLTEHLTRAREEQRHEVDYVCATLD